MCPIPVLYRMATEYQPLRQGEHLEGEERLVEVEACPVVEVEVVEVHQEEGEALQAAGVEVWERVAPQVVGEEEVAGVWQRAVVGGEVGEEG